jgi:hypothetical protein
MQIKIEKNVPVMKQRAGSGASESGIIAALKTLQIGESFVVPVALRNMLSGGITTLRREDKTRKYLTRQIGQTLRCWRIAPVQVEPTVQLEADLEYIKPEEKNTQVFVPLNDTINNALSGNEKDRELLESLMQGLVSEYLSKIRKE